MILFQKLLHQIEQPTQDMKEKMKKKTYLSPEVEVIEVEASKMLCGSDPMEGGINFLEEYENKEI